MTRGGVHGNDKRLGQESRHTGTRLYIGVAGHCRGGESADPAQFDIAAQPLPNALKTFATQAKMQLLYRYDIVSRATATAVAGKLEKHAALEQMLHGTGLEAVYSNEDTATIRG